MKIMYFIGLIFLSVLIVGCTTPETMPVEEQVEEPGVIEEPEPEVEDLTEKMIDVKLMKEGFETSEIKIGTPGRLTIISEDRVMHKLTGGDLFKEQFNTHLKSIFGNQDSLGRNELNVVFSEAGEYEIKDLTSNTILKVIAE